MKKKILITGAAIKGLGAQAMGILTAYEMNIRFPQYEVLFTMANTECMRSNLEEWKVKFVPFDIPFKKKLFSEEIVITARMERLLKQTAFIIDVSGYAFSSQWGIRESIIYLKRFALYEKLNIPIYLMPQSFGPFDYPGFINKIRIKRMTREVMAKMKLICAREKCGYEVMKPFSANGNLKLIRDLVLTYHRELRLENIFTHPEKLNFIDLSTSNNVAIIPNMRLFTHTDRENAFFFSLYVKIIKHLKKLNKSVYLLFHDKEDYAICESLKNKFINVNFIKSNLNFIEFEYLVKQFDFTISSRFHAIVHAYKSNIPCIALGWADKYKELLTLLKNEKYYFDTRTLKNEEDVIKAIDYMNRNCKKEKEIISRSLEKLREQNVFEYIKQ